MRSKSKYVSLCDGDDYFTDPLKLQKQVDFLEKNPDCALCFHPVTVLYEDDSREPAIYPPLSMLSDRQEKTYHLQDLFQNNMIQTNSVVYRWRFRDGLPNWFRADLTPGDWYWHLLHAETGKIGFLEDVMSVYRRHKKAMYHTTQISIAEHRLQHGMAELKTYHIVNQHFNGRFFHELTRLSNGIFANFMEISKKTNDDSLLVNAVREYPEFAKSFLENIQTLQNNTQ